MQAPRHRTVQSTSVCAIWSLVLSIIGICSAVPLLGAIICGHWGIARIRRSEGKLGGGGLAVAGLVIGYVALVVWAGFGFFFWKFSQGLKKMEELQKIESIVQRAPVPDFPELPEFSHLDPAGVRLASLTMPPNPGNDPGTGMTFRIYLPAGDDVPDSASLPCVLVAPAGTNLLSGSDLDDGDYHDETLPYAEAGMVVVNYSIDGMPADDSDETSVAASAYEAFKKAGAGVVNGRNALEFALARLPMVDPDRVYAAGHSSAATLALLLAAHEPRLAGCLAYAPATDLESHFMEATSQTGIELVFPGLRRFVRNSSPLTHVDRISMPVFFFYAEDDSMVTPESVEPFLSRLRTVNQEVNVRKVSSGGHYQSMIDQGIPSGIIWIRNLD